MIILVSPAKSLDLSTPFQEQPRAPRFAAEANRLARAAAKLGAARLGELMHISPQLAELNAARFKTFAAAEERPAIRTFAGDVYRGFDAASADEATLEYAQAHLRILSGLYGVLRPFDGIRPYRLEMGTRWSPKDDSLTDFWGTKVARAVLSDLREDGSGTLLNLASNEYFAAVGPHLPKRGIRVIAPDFRVRTAKGMQFQSFVAKVARGTMARWVCEERIAEPSALPSFDVGGWRHQPEGSTDDRPLFVRSA
ncbi:YaaA family protein [Sphingomonas sp. GCM10030256]|uniref:YaaA family protein n=1 Tax=Sphingomonas sp. GCM10030256 TaxID=3273427 RepID=UPI0036240D2B